MSSSTFQEYIFQLLDFNPTSDGIGEPILEFKCFPSMNYYNDKIVWFYSMNFKPVRFIKLQFPLKLQEYIMPEHTMIGKGILQLKDYSKIMSDLLQNVDINVNCTVKDIVQYLEYIRNLNMIVSIWLDNEYILRPDIKVVDNLISSGNYDKILKNFIHQCKLYTGYNPLPVNRPKINGWKILPKNGCQSLQSCYSCQKEIYNPSNITHYRQLQALNDSEKADWYKLLCVYVGIKPNQDSDNVGILKSIRQLVDYIDQPDNRRIYLCHICCSKYKCVSFPRNFHTYLKSQIYNNFKFANLKLRRQFEDLEEYKITITNELQSKINNLSTENECLRILKSELDKALALKCTNDKLESHIKNMHSRHRHLQKYKSSLDNIIGLEQVKSNYSQIMVDISKNKGQIKQTSKKILELYDDADDYSQLLVCKVCYTCQVSVISSCGHMICRECYKCLGDKSGCFICRQKCSYSRMNFI